MSSTTRASRWSGAARGLADEDWDRALAVDLKPVFLASHAAWPHLRGRAGGATVNMASVGGMGDAGEAACATAKAGVVMLDELHGPRRRRGRHPGQRVRPGFVAIPMLERSSVAQDDLLGPGTGVEALHPLGRLATRATSPTRSVPRLDEARW